MGSNERRPTRPIPQGVVKTEYLGDGWYTVGIGRARGAKWFNLSDAEARQLVDRLAELGITPSVRNDQVKTG